MRRRDSAVFFISLILFSLVPPLEFRRSGGGGLGGSRGSSGSRASSGGGFARTGNSRGSSSGSGGWFRGGTGNRNEYSRGTNLGSNRQSAPSGGGWNSGGGGGGQSYKPSGSMNTGSKGGFLGGLFGRRHGSSPSSHQAGYGSRSGWGGSRWTNSGLGSRSRGSQFKNMIVGAAAGYLTYQAGKAIIRAAAGPMMWNNRPYYWGSNHYRQTPGHTNMCRMPIDSSDPQFGNVYFSDQSRPREIVWGCGYYEYCCGYECCRGGDSAGSYRVGNRGSIGYAIMIVFLARRLLF